MRHVCDILIKEIEILEQKERTEIADDADDEESFSPVCRSTFDCYPRPVVDKDEKNENKDVPRNERHVEIGARTEEDEPLMPRGQ